MLRAINITVIFLLAFLVIKLITQNPQTPPKQDFSSNEKGPLFAKDLHKKCPHTNAFDYPVGPPNANNYYNAQVFGKNKHLGDDWNGKGGGNTDLGDPVYAISDGIVVYAQDAEGGWGNIVRIYHKFGSKANPKAVESFYAHLKEMNVKSGEIVKRGQQIGTIGNVNGLYLAHLHFEIRSILGMPIGPGYSENALGYLDPTEFIESHRKIKN